MYGAWREAADTNKINWPLPVLFVRLPGTHSSKFGGGEIIIKNWNWELASSRTGPKPNYIVSGSFFNELKKNQGFFWLVGFTQVGPGCYFEENNSGINFF